MIKAPTLTGILSFSGARSWKMNATTQFTQGQLPVQTYVREFIQLRFDKAVESGNSKELRRVLQEDSPTLNLNAMNSEGLSPLHKSVMEGNLDCVKLLVRYGADIRLATRDGWSPLHLATWTGNMDVLVYLLKHNRR